MSEHASRAVTPAYERSAGRNPHRGIGRKVQPTDATSAPLARISSGASQHRPIAADDDSLPARIGCERVHRNRSPGDRLPLPRHSGREHHYPGAGRMSWSDLGCCGAADRDGDGFLRFWLYRPADYPRHPRCGRVPCYRGLSRCKEHASAHYRSRKETT